MEANKPETMVAIVFLAPGEAPGLSVHAVAVPTCLLVCVMPRHYAQACLEYLIVASIDDSKPLALDGGETRGAAINSSICVCVLGVALTFLFLFAVRNNILNPRAPY